MYNLYLIYVGAKSNSLSIESHDIIFVVGTSIDDTHQQIKSKWLGEKYSLHIDSYSIIKYIEGYKILAKRIVNKNHQDLNKGKLYLWFVYLGGYENNNLQESHQILFVVSNSRLEAKRKAKAG